MESLLKSSQIPVIYDFGISKMYIVQAAKEWQQYNCVSPYAHMHSVRPSALMLFWSWGYFEGFGFDSPLTVFTCALSLRGQRSLSLPEKGYVGCSFAAEGWGNPLIRDWLRESIASNRLLLLKYSTGPVSCNKKSSFLFKEAIVDADHGPMARILG